MKMELQKVIKSLIAKKSEGSYWDFKQKWHEDNADLLKDIICMANNTTIDMQDGYIIFGVEDSTFNIIGVLEDNKRKKQADIIDLLSSKSWSGEEIPNVDVKSIEIDEKEMDVLIVYNIDATPYYLTEDFPPIGKQGKNRVVLRTGVIYSRVGDCNTSSVKCATKQATEFLWKKRFGLVGSDEFKVIKRLKNIRSWYSIDEYDTLYNSEYGDIKIQRAFSDASKVEIDEGCGETGINVMDFPYLFASICNWNIGKKEIIRMARWDIFLDNRKLDIALYGVQATKQTYYHIEPKRYWSNELGICLDKTTNSIRYYAYIRDSIEFLGYKLFFEMQCSNEEQKIYNKAFTVIPVFENEQEHERFMDYIKIYKNEFKAAVEEQSIEEMFPFYAQTVDTVIVYKVGKTLVQWLEQWRLALKR